MSMHYRQVSSHMIEALRHDREEPTSYEQQRIQLASHDQLLHDTIFARANELFDNSSDAMNAARVAFDALHLVTHLEFIREHSLDTQQKTEPFLQLILPF